LRARRGDLPPPHFSFNLAPVTSFVERNGADMKLKQNWVGGKNPVTGPD
jgi:hypothetical protein